MIGTHRNGVMAVVGKRGQEDKHEHDAERKLTACDFCQIRTDVRATSNGGARVEYHDGTRTRLALRSGSEELGEGFEAGEGIGGRWGIARAGIPAEHAGEEGDGAELGGEAVVRARSSQAHLAVGVIGAGRGRTGANDGDEVADGVVAVIGGGVLDVAVQVGDAGFDGRFAVEAPGEIGCVAVVSGGVVGFHDPHALESELGEGFLTRGELAVGVVWVIGVAGVVGEEFDPRGEVCGGRVGVAV